jgi:hypothetical protein
MSKFRATTLFQQGKGGWSESFYLESTSPAAALVTIQAPSALRRRLLGTDARIIGYRAQEVSAVGNALITDVDEPAIGGEIRDIPSLALNIALNTTDGLKRTFLLRGLPDNATTRGVYVPGSTFNGNLNSWMGVIANGNYLVRRLDRAQLPKPVASVSGTGLATFFVAHALTIGATVQFMRTRDAAGHLVTGRFRVLDTPTLTTVQLSPWVAGRTITTGTLRRVEFIYPAVSSAVNSLKITTRKVGRPFGAPRGRRSVRR